VRRERALSSCIGYTDCDRCVSGNPVLSKLRARARNKLYGLCMRFKPAVQDMQSARILSQVVHVDGSMSAGRRRNCIVAYSETFVFSVTKLRYSTLLFCS